ncbi:MFS transporter [Archaeoglobus sulfaticallidus]|uniref:MFS transporter n=1 Tax=Archaeoglobus sulfaticallidus TaxID=1316941 RepID=UPI000ACFE360|nr:MFS transporter [Archaeoglobus sulfaticallidus]
MFGISLSAFIVMLGMGIITPLLPIFAQDLGASGIWIGVIFSAYSFSRLVFLPISGMLSDRYGRRRTILLGLFLYSSVTFLYILSKTPEQLSFVRMLHGITSAMIIPVAMASVGDISIKGKEGFFIGKFNQSLFLGMASGPIVGGVLNDILGMKLTFMSLSFFGFFTLLVVFISFPETVTTRKEKKPVFRNSKLWIAFIFRFINSMGRGSILSFLPIYLGFLNYSTTVIGSLVSLNLFISALIQPSFGRLSDRVGVRYPVIMSALAGAGILFALPRVSSLDSLIFLSVLLGITSAMSIPAVGAIVAVEGKKGGMGQLMGILSASKSLGRVVGPVVSGVIFDVFGGGIYGVRMAFTLASLLSVSSAIIFWIGYKD